MNEREFIKLVRELHLLQLKVLGEEHLSIEIRLSRIKPAAYVSFFLNIYDSQRNIRELYFKIMYSDSIVAFTLNVLESTSVKLIRMEERRRIPSYVQAKRV